MTLVRKHVQVGDHADSLDHSVLSRTLHGVAAAPELVTACPAWYSGCPFPDSVPNRPRWLWQGNKEASSPGFSNRNMGPLCHWPEHAMLQEKALTS